MTIEIELDPELKERLVEAARAHGLAVEEYAEGLLRDAVVLRSRPSGRLSQEELRAMLVAIAEGSEKLPSLPTNAFSRESLYQDRS